MSVDYVSSSAAVCEAVLRLRGDVLAHELGRIARAMLDSPVGDYIPAEQLRRLEEQGTSDLFPAAADGIQQDVTCDGHLFGRFQVSGGKSYSEDDRRHLAGIASVAASMLQVHSLAQRSTHAYVQVEAQLAHQSQILDQIHESVLTTDMSGFITSWNKGAERLFGYSSVEAVGRNILFLYEDEETGFDDDFLQNGGRMMEVRRKKKSGEVFWASLSLSPLHDLHDKPIGLIAYLTDITERKLAEERLHHLAYYDALTGLPNRSLLTALADQALAVAQRSKAMGAMLFLNLNRFKVINETLGRETADLLLKQAGERFRACLRDQDVVARLNGDEFAVALFDIGQHYEATTVAHKLQAVLSEPFVIDGHDLRVGASIGISVYPQDGNDGETLLRHADIAMARAKLGEGANDDGIAFFSDDMNRGMLERIRIESGLRNALGTGQLLLHYQPKFEIDGAHIIGAEALVRWAHPERGLIPPAEFIPLAEATGLVVPLGEWVLETACAQAAKWQREGIPPMRIAVNVSAREFTQALPGRVAETLKRYQLDPSWLELEITESTVMQNIEKVIAIMDRITALGVVLSLDDFGTGYSSLSYLKRFPIDTLKIDRSFTTGIPADSNDCAIASTIISIGQQLKHRVIAEGVETAAQLTFLRDSGCDEVQGYLFSKPLPADEFEQMLRDTWSRAA
jgi:diguanylate cyclase (GGDEF)-like protein/PAS domain S-box-containing protein